MRTRLSSLSSLVRGVLLGETVSVPPPDPQEGEWEVPADRTDGFNQIHADTRRRLRDKFSGYSDPFSPDGKMPGVLSMIPRDDRAQVERDQHEVGDEWLDRYMSRLDSRPLTAEEVRLLTRDSSISDYLRDAYNRRVSWCLLTEGLVASLRDVLLTLGARKVVELGAGRGSLARIMRGRGFSWRAFDATSVHAKEVERAPAARVAATLRPGECDVILVSWVHYEADWDMGLIDAAARVRVPIVSIGVSPDPVGSRRDDYPTLTHSPDFWSRVERECAVTRIRVDSRDEIMVITPPTVPHPMPETSYHSSQAEDIVLRVGFELERANRKDSDVSGAIPWLLGLEQQGTDYEDEAVAAAKRIIKMAEQATQIQNRDARGRGDPLMPPPSLWLPPILLGKQRDDDILTLLRRPEAGVWVRWES